MVALHDTVAVPEPDRPVGLMDPQVKPDGTLSVSDTVPVNPFCAPTVIVDVVLWPALTADGDEAVMMKSGWFTMNVAVVVWTREPLVPVNDRVKVPPALALHETVAVPEPDRLVGLMDPHVSPEGTLSVSATLPEKPFCALIVIVEPADWPGLTAPGEVAEIAKSGLGAVVVQPTLGKLTLSWSNWYPSIPISIPASWQGVDVGMPHAASSP